MDKIIDSYKKSKNLHHAYFLIGERSLIIQDLTDFLNNTVGFMTEGNPDFIYRSIETLTIDEARSIAEMSERKDFSGGKKVFLIYTDFISIEAQNSLLKVFEEPTEGTHFFIISPQDILLPTLRSRMQVVYSDNSEFVASENILQLNLKERLAKVKSITDGISDEENTKQDAILLLNQIERELYEKGVEKSSTALRLCESSRASLYDRGAPIKIILENLLLNV